MLKKFAGQMVPTQQVSFTVEVCLQQEEITLSVTHKQVCSKSVSVPSRELNHRPLAMEHSSSCQHDTAQGLKTDRAFIYAKVIEAYETASSFPNTNSPHMTVRT